MSTTAVWLWISTNTVSIHKKWMALDCEAIYPRNQVVEALVDGSPTVSSGKQWTQKKFVLLAAEAPTQPDEGSLAELVGLHALRNPNGTPSSILTLEDYEGSYEAIWLGELRPKPAGVLVGTTGAMWQVEAEFLKVN